MHIDKAQEKINLKREKLVMEMRKEKPFLYNYVLADVHALESEKFVLKQ